MAKKTRFATNLTLPNSKRVYISAKSKEELDLKVAKAKLEIGMGVDISDATTFEDYAKMWVQAYKAPPKIRENSYATLLCNLNNHVIPFFGQKKLRSIRPIDVQMFLTSISHLSKSTQSKCIQIARGIFSTAVDNNLIARSPMTSNDKASGETAEEEEALTDAQAKALLSAVEGTRAHLFCLLALSLGLRRGEILALMWDDIDFKKATVSIRHNKTFPGGCNDAPVTTLVKSESARRTLPIPPYLLKELTAERKQSTSPYVLSMENGNSLSLSSFRSLWDIVTSRTVSDERELGSTVVGSKSGPIVVSLDFNCHPHQLRHTYATKLFEGGCDVKEVQYLLGHSTPEMTMRVYTHYRKKSREAETASKVHGTMAYLGG